MPHSPKFEMPDKTVGEKWHEEVENENPIFSFIVLLSFFLMIFTIIIVVGGSQTMAMGYQGKDVLEAKDDVEFNPPVEEFPETPYEPVTENTPVEEPVYLEQPYSPNPSTLMVEGVQYSEDGTRYTWYSQNVLPGGGLDIPGRHVGDWGFIMDVDGNLCVASSDHEKGTVLETPYGTAIVYDTGCDSGIIDMYTSW